VAQSEKAVRLFIAVPVPKAIKENISKLQADLKELISGKKIRWVNPENIHLTLKFLGETDPSKIEKIKKIIAESIEKLSEFDVSIAAGGVFPSKSRPRVLWVGCIDKNENIINIKNKLDKKLKPLGYEIEKKKFTAHLTLGRVKNPNSISRCIEKLVSGETNFGKLQVQEIQLIVSILSPKGAQYRIVESIKLQEK